MFVDKPGKPGTPEVKEANKTSATLTWKPPSDNGGSEITNYVVEYRADGAFKWKRATESVIPSTTYVVKGLEEKVKYEFRVAAENKAGVGPPSEGSLAVKLEDAMGTSSRRRYLLPKLYTTLFGSKKKKEKRAYIYPPPIHCTYNLYKNSFLPRCLFKFV